MMSEPEGAAHLYVLERGASSPPGLYRRGLWARHWTPKFWHSSIMNAYSFLGMKPAPWWKETHFLYWYQCSQYCVGIICIIHTPRFVPLTRLRRGDPRRDGNHQVSELSPEFPGQCGVFLADHRSPGEPPGDELQHRLPDTRRRRHLPEQLRQGAFTEPRKTHVQRMP